MKIKKVKKGDKDRAWNDKTDNEYIYFIVDENMPTSLLFTKNLRLDLELWEGIVKELKKEVLEK